MSDGKETIVEGLGPSNKKEEIKTKAAPKAAPKTKEPEKKAEPRKGSNQVKLRFIQSSKFMLGDEIKSYIKDDTDIFEDSFARLLIKRGIAVVYG